MRGLSRREKIIAGITLIVIMVSVGYNFVVVPWIERSQQLDKQLALANGQLQNYSALLSRKNTITVRFEEAFSSMADNTALGNDPVLSVIAEIESLARANNVQVIDIRPQGSADSEQEVYQEQLFTLRTQGGLEGYLRFIYAVEHSLSLLHIKRMSLVAKQQSQVIEGGFILSQVTLER